MESLMAGVTAGFSNMYSVLRISKSQKNSVSITSLAEKFKLYLPDLFDGIDHCGDRFSCSICDSAKWSDHEKKISELIKSLDPFFDEVNAELFELEIDIAVYYSEDKRDALYFAFVIGSPMMKKLADLNISLIYSLYE